ncbi:MAG: substrate-binding domain-containing protein [Deferribacterales bacterium]
MKRAQALFFAVILSAFSAFGAQKDFFTVSEYMLMHPEQAWKFDSFVNIVRSAPVPLKTTNAKPAKIAVVYPAVQASDYWRRSVKVLEKRLAELNVNYTLTTYFSRPSGDSRLQMAQLAEAAAGGADFIIVSADSSQMRKAVGRLLFEGKHEIIIQNLTTPLREWEPSRPLLYTGFDHIAGSAMLADAVADTVPQNSSYAVLNCSGGEVGYLRTKGFTDRLASRGRYVRKAEYITDFDREKSKIAAKEILRVHPDVSFIFACATDVALGAADALREAGAQKIILNGWGGGNAELELIKQKELDLTVMRMNDESSVAAAEAVKFVLSGRANDVPVVFSGDFSLVTSADSADEIKMLKKRAFRYSGENEQD